MSAPTQVVIDWISGLGWDTRQELGYPLVPGPYVPTSPDRMVVITNGGGPGFTTEETATDASNYQVRLRGAPEDPLDAETAAGQLDLLLVRASFPVQVDGTWLLACSRVGSGPTPLPWDPSDQRTEFTANYTIVTGA
jgi:hypothetical protein